MAGKRPDVSEQLAQLTLVEKAALLDGSDRWRTEPVPRLGVPALTLADGPHGLRKQPEDVAARDVRGSYPATCFPPAVALAATWDRDLVSRVGDALGREARAAGIAVLLGPGVNMKRSPLCGRNFEYYSEDPYLAGELATAFVRGVQGQGVGACVKHFAANNQETNRRYVSAEVDERTLREIYFPAFEKVVKEAQPWTVMCSYNRINGVYSSQNPWLLTEVLRQEWGFTGLVMSDWDAVEVRERGVAAGLDLEMPSSWGVGQRRIVAAVESGQLSETAVDACARRVLELADRAGNASQRQADPFDDGAHHTLAREAASRAAVLLKNDDGLLPLARAGGPVAVIGEFARTPRYQGAGSSQVVPTRLDDALSNLQEALGDREVTFAPGFELESDSPALIAEATERAAAADVAVLFLGLPPSYESEGYDRDHMGLPPVQLELLRAVAAVNPNVVVVLANGAAVTVEWQHHARAVLEGWLLGQAGGAAVADLLVGAVNPSGKLAETLPLREAHTPTVGNFPGDAQVHYGEGLLIGYRWYDAHELDVAFPFGHGLSYTTFEYRDLELRTADDGAEATFTVTNAGTVAGREIAQVYVSDPEAAVFRPSQELKGFAVVDLAPGESSRLSVSLGERAFSYWHPALRRWVTENGDFEIRVGSSSRDIRLTGVVQLGEPVVAPLGPEVPTARWLAHPVAGPHLRTALAGDPEYDEYRMSRLDENPMARVARMRDFPIPESELPELAAQANAALEQ